MPARRRHPRPHTDTAFTLEFMDDSEVWNEGPIRLRSAHWNEVEDAKSSLVMQAVRKKASRSAEGRAPGLPLGVMLPCTGPSAAGKACAPPLQHPAGLRPACSGFAAWTAAQPQQRPAVTTRASTRPTGPMLCNSSQIERVVVKLTPCTASATPGRSLDPRSQSAAPSGRRGEQGVVSGGTEHASTAEDGGGGSSSAPPRRRGRAGGPRSPDDVNPARLTALIRGAETVQQLCRLCEVHVAQVLLGEKDDKAALRGAVGAPAAGGRAGPSFRSRPPARTAMDSIAAAAAASRCGRKERNQGGPTPSPLVEPHVF